MRQRHGAAPRQEVAQLFEVRLRPGGEPYYCESLGDALFVAATAPNAHVYRVRVTADPIRLLNRRGYLIEREEAL